MDAIHARPLILVVEDDEVLAEIERELLVDEAYRVITVAHSEQSEIAAIGPDLVVLDVVLDGDVTGYHLLKELKADPSTKHISVLVITALTGPRLAAMRSELDALGCHVLTKPFDIEMLLEMVRDCLSLEPVV
jgi:two-component system, cell cycle response regulator